MKHKKLIKRILLTVCSVVLIFFVSFMIGSDFGEHPLFFLNTKTVKQVVRYTTLENDIIIPDQYQQVLFITNLRDADFVISFKNYRKFKYTSVSEIQLRFFGKVKIVSPLEFTDPEKNVDDGGVYAVLGPFVFKLKE